MSKLFWIWQPTSNTPFPSPRALDLLEENEAQHCDAERGDQQESNWYSRAVSPIATVGAVHLGRRVAVAQLASLAIALTLALAIALVIALAITLALAVALATISAASGVVRVGGRVRTMRL